MNRALLLGIGAVGVAVAAIPAIAMAADFPPPPPSTYYGSVPTGVAPGQGVVAIVLDGGNSSACGTGATLTDPQSGKVVYVVDVIADAQQAGCGKSGRTVMFYFTGVGGGRLSTDAPAAWSGPGPVKVDVATVSAPLPRRGTAPEVAKDGTY